MVTLVIRLQFHFLSPLLFLTGYNTYDCMHSYVPSLYIVCKPFPVLHSHVHDMALMSTSGPAGAWEITNTRITPFIAKPNKHKSSGDSLCWFAAL